MKGVIVAAGYGTRFLPVTKSLPKEMLPLIDKPAIGLIVEKKGLIFGSELSDTMQDESKKTDKKDRKNKG